MKKIITLSLFLFLSACGGGGSGGGTASTTATPAAEAATTGQFGNATFGTAKFSQ